MWEKLVTEKRVVIEFDSQFEVWVVTEQRAGKEPAVCQNLFKPDVAD